MLQLNMYSKKILYGKQVKEHVNFLISRTNLCACKMLF